MSTLSPVTKENIEKINEQSNNELFESKIRRSHSLDMQRKNLKSEKWLEQCFNTNVPTRMLLEEQFIEYPYNNNFGESDYMGDFDSKFDSRRQSLATEDGEDGGHPRCRYWRTPSVVVSDYSDDVQGMTLDDIDFIQSQQNRKEYGFSSSECSLNSSCSNLNYCGSNISVLDAEYSLRMPSSRKGSECSSCSTLSGDEECDSNLPVIKTRRKDSKVSQIIILSF